MLIASSIKEPRVSVLQAAGDRAHASVPCLQRQMRLVLRDVAGMQARPFFTQGSSKLFEQCLELSLARDNSPVRYAAQSDVVPTERNRWQSCETRHQWLLHD